MLHYFMKHCWMRIRTPRAMLVGPSATVAAAMPPFTPCGPAPMIRLSFCFVKSARGIVRTCRRVYSAAPCCINSATVPPRTAIHSAPLSGISRNTCALSNANNPALRGPGVILSPNPSCPRNRRPGLSLYLFPRRHPQGARGFFCFQIPRLCFLASASARAIRNSLGQYCRYQCAHPLRTISRLTSCPSPLNTLLTTRPYRSPSTMLMLMGSLLNNILSIARLPLNPIWPCSGASMPHSLTRIPRPWLSTTSKVSPS